MKKIFAVLLSAISLSTASFAQKKVLQDKGDITIGFTIGVNASLVSVYNANNSTTYGTTDTKAGINAGVEVESYFNTWWSFKAKALYDQRGWSNGFVTIGNATMPTDYQLHYVTVPLLAGFHFGTTRNWYLHAGPYISVLAAANTTTATRIDVKSSFNSIDAGVDGGIGIKFPVSDRARLFIELNVLSGVTTIDNSNANISYNAQDMRNGVVSANIGVNF
jgi:hypothetical protein